MSRASFSALGWNSPNFSLRTVRGLYPVVSTSVRRGTHGPQTRDPSTLLRRHLEIRPRLRLHSFGPRIMEVVLGYSSQLDGRHLPIVLNVVPGHLGHQVPVADTPCLNPNRCVHSLSRIQYDLKQPTIGDR